MPNEKSQRLLRARPEEVVDRLISDPSGRDDDATALETLVRSIPGADLSDAVRALGGHDVGLLLDTCRAVEGHRPTVVFAYTMKGGGLPTEGHPNNHSAQLKPEQMVALATGVGEDVEDPWRPSGPRRLPPSCAAVDAERPSPDLPSLPADPRRTPGRSPDTGPDVPHGDVDPGGLRRFLTDLRRAAPETAARMVTLA